MRLQQLECGRISAVFGTALLLAVGVAPLTAGVSESYQQTLSLSPGGSLAVSNVNGTIEVTAADSDEVHIRAVKKADNRAKLDDTEIEVRSEGDRVEIETHLPRNGGGSVNYEITAPFSVDVQVSTVNGRVIITGFDGDVEAKSVNGAIQAAGLAGAASIKTVNGSVSAHYAQTPRSGEHHYKAVNGSLQIQMPSSPDASFEAKSVNGSIQNDFGMEVVKARFGPMKSLNGTLGSGAASFELETVNGSIKILNSGAAADVR